MAHALAKDFGGTGSSRVLILLCAALVLALSLSITVRAERLPVKIYTSADGLGSSFVNYIMRDSRGFMWFCTRDGLSRFDGNRFVTYSIGDRNSPPGIESITETRDGTYWIGTTGGLYRFKRDAASQPDQANSNRPRLNAEFIDNSRGLLLEDREGVLWYGPGSLNRLEEKDGKVSLSQVALNLPVPPNRRSGIVRMIEAGDGSLWIDTSAGLVRRLPDERLIFYPAETSFTEGHRSLLSDPDGRIWYLLGLELYVLKPEPLESLKGLERITVRQLSPYYLLPARTGIEIRLPERAGEVLRLGAGDFLSRYPGRRLYRTSDNHIWMTTDRELMEFDGRVFHRFTVAQGLSQGMASIAEDSAGNLWIGGQTALIRLDRRGLISYGEADGFHSPSVHAINEAKDGTLYFADGDFYLARFDGESFETTRLAVGPGSRILWTSRYALLDSRNEWWVLTNEKLYRFGASNLKRPLASYTSKDGLKADAMFQIFEDRRGDIWVSVQAGNSSNNGLARFDRGANRFHTFTEAEGFPPGKSVSSFAEDNNGNLWLGFYEGGLARYDGNRFTQFNSADGLPGGLITDLLVDRSGRLWLTSSNGGVSRIDDPGAQRPGFVSLTARDGLSSNNTRTIVEDRFGNIYVGSVRGIDRISPETSRIKYYSVSDGLAGDTVVDSHCDRNGVLWFATTNGLSRLSPTADESQAPPAIWVGGLRIAGIPQALPELGANDIGPVELSHTENNLQLDFFGLQFDAGEALRYQYRLEGADADWSAPTEQRTVTLANLSSGSYRFLVRAINSEGVTSSQPASVTFEILPPFWLQWWFISLVILLAAAILYSFYRYRTARLREINAALAEAKRAEEALGRSRQDRLVELERVRARIATDLHDDIGSSLTQIAILSEVARQQSSGEGGNGAAPIARIISISNELVDTMSDIVWAINPKKDHLSDLLQRMRRFASDVFTARHIAFRFHAPDTEREIELGANVRREVFLIFKESVNNVVKHSGCTRAEITFQIEDDWLVLKVSDNGKGFDKDRPDGGGPAATTASGGNGILSMRRRAQEMGGELEIASSPGLGTTATLRLLIAQKQAESR